MKVSFYIVFLMLLLACQKEKPIENKNMLEDRVLVDIPILPTSIDYSLPLSDGTQWNLRLTATTSPDTAALLPLIIALHFGGNETAYQSYHNCLAKPGFEEIPCILVSPEDNGLGWRHETNHALLSEFIDQAIADWPVDPAKVVITGYSNGGIGTWYYADAFKDRLVAAIPMGGFYEEAYAFKIPLYVIHGENDEVFPIEQVRNQVESATQAGSQIQWTEATDRTHYESCEYVTYLKEAAEWLEDSIW